MKMQLRIVLLLALGAQVVYPAAIVVKRATGAQRNELVTGMNAARAEAATKFKISNMHELSYDVDLEKKAETINCDAPATGSFMVIAEPSKDLIEKIQTTPPEKQEEIWAEIIGSTIITALGPKQTRIGCAEREGKAKCSGASSLCLIGPLSSVSESDFQKGEPGSKCPNGKASSGLCKYSTSTLSFASVLLIVVSFLFI